MKRLVLSAALATAIARPAFAEDDAQQAPGASDDTREIIVTAARSIISSLHGEPVSGPEDIADYPAEAIARIELLPRGSASRIGGAGGQRAYNIVLRDPVTTVTATASYRGATEGGWGEARGEVLGTHIRKQD